MSRKEINLTFSVQSCDIEVDLRAAIFVPFDNSVLVTYLSTTDFSINLKEKTLRGKHVETPTVFELEEIEKVEENKSK